VLRAFLEHLGITEPYRGEDGTVRIAGCVAAAALVSVLPFDLTAQSGGYRTLQGDHQIAVEYFHWSGHMLEATVDASGYRLVTQMQYGEAWPPIQD